MKPQLKFPQSPVAALLVAMFSIQGGAVFAKTLFPVLGFAGTAVLRISLAAVLLSAIFRPVLGQIRREDWQLVLLFGLSLGLMNMSYYRALSEMPNGPVVTIEFAGPLLLAAALSRRRLDLLWVGLAALGVILMMSPGAGVIWSSTGLLFAGLAAFFWAAYIFFGGQLSQRLPGGAAITAGMWVAALVTWPLGIGQLGPVLNQPLLLGAGLLVAILSSAVPYTLEMVALRQLSPTVFGVLLSLEPAVAALMGWWVLDERLAGMQWLALGLVVLASAGISSKAARPKAS